MFPLKIDRISGSTLVGNIVEEFQYLKSWIALFEMTKPIFDFLLENEIIKVAIGLNDGSTGPQ